MSDRLPPPPDRWVLYPPDAVALTAALDDLPPDANRVRIVGLNLPSIADCPTLLDGLRVFLNARPEWTVIVWNRIEPGSLTISRHLDDQTRPPNYLRRALNLTRALAAHAAAGFRLVPLQVWHERVDLCLMCPHRTFDTCGLCGCPVEDKASWASEACPDTPERWSSSSQVERD